MNVNTLNRNFALPVSVILIVSLLIWGLGLPTWIKYAYAAPLTNIKDTLSDSDLLVPATHTIQFTTQNPVTEGQTIKIQFDPSGDAFNLGSLEATDIAVVGMTLVDVCDVGTDEVTVAIDATEPDENVTFTVCAGDTILDGAKTITLGNLGKIINPVGAGSYIISIGGTMADSGRTRVAIIDDVVVTASVATSFTFTITGVNSGEVAANGEAGTTDVTTTATSIPWGELTAGAAKKAVQQVAVATNAKNGFVVTLQQDQNLTSSTGADIDLFKNGGATAVPEVWAVPSATQDFEGTYGHYGITSEDTDLNGDEFGTALYAGNINTPRQVFSHTGPARPDVANKGFTRIGFKIEISALQEPGEDYTNSLTYIATPTF